MFAKLRNLAIVVVLAAAMVLAGRLVGGYTAPEGPISEAEVLRLLENLDRPDGNRIDPTTSHAVAGLHVPLTGDAHWPSVMEELALARKYGVGMYVLSVELPWGREPWDSLPRVAEALTLLTGAEIWIAVDLNPPVEWIEDHPEEASTFLLEGIAYPSIGSQEWRDAASDALVAASREIAQAQSGARIAGVILQGLEGGGWYRTIGYDHSIANQIAFDTWLEEKYTDPGALSAAWKAGYASFEGIGTPDPPVEQKGIFFNGPQAPVYADYMEYLNESTAGVISYFAARVRETFGAEVLVFASYGSIFDEPWPEHAQWGIGTVLGGTIDGLVLGVNRQDRGVGAAGGAAGPSTVPSIRSKRWLLLDDTRTGIGWNASANSVFKPAGFEARTLASIYDRNLVMAAMERGGVIWSDARGQGNFLDDSLWDHLASRVPVLDELQNRDTLDSRTVLVVLDERSMRYVADGGRVGESLINASRRAVQEAGTSYGYVLLEDLLAGRAPEARVFIFPNLFAVDEAETETIHAYLTEHGAAAIWLYAPGALTQENAAAGVSRVVRMSVGVYDKPVHPDSTFSLAGSGIPENEPILRDEPWLPLFYIDDEDADSIAKYAETKDSSIGVKFMEEGWASVFVAAPGLTPELLQEILEILDHPVVIAAVGPERRQSIAVQDEYLFVHAREAGDREFRFQGRFDVVDVLNSEFAWPRKSVLQLPLRAGESRFLKLTESEPLAGEDFVDEAAPVAEKGLPATDSVPEGVDAQPAPADAIEQR